MPTSTSFCEQLTREQDKFLHIHAISTYTNNTAVVQQKQGPKNNQLKKNKRNKGPKKLMYPCSKRLPSSKVQGKENSQMLYALWTRWPSRIVLLEENGNFKGSHEAAHHLARSSSS
jgi:hypothetical protein